MSEQRPPSVDSGLYGEDYYRQSCGGGEFFSKFGPRILKPQLAYSLSRAGLSPGMTVLDAGCGRGELLFHARAAGVRAFGSDYAAAALPLARKVSGAPVLRCDARFLPFASRSFDLIFFIGVIDHLHDWELKQAFAEFARVLKPGGRVLIHTCVNRTYYKNWSFGLRRALAKAFGLKEPAPPRSDEDAALHVNEHSLGDIARFLDGIGWRHDIAAMPNYKHLARELYGDPAPEGLPLKATPAWRAWTARALLRTPLKFLLAREIFAEAFAPRG